MSIRLIFAIAGAIICLAIVPASSLGQSLSNDAYSNQATQVLGTTGESGEPPAPTTTSSSRTLPFTGFEVGMVALVGIILVGSGFALRRAYRSSDS